MIGACATENTPYVIILARCFRMLGLKSKSVNERADSADVIAESVHYKYSLVADAKCFRI